MDKQAAIQSTKLVADGPSKRKKNRNDTCSGVPGYVPAAVIQFCEPSGIVPVQLTVGVNYFFLKSCSNTERMGQTFCGTEGRDHHENVGREKTRGGRDDVLADVVLSKPLRVRMPPKIGSRVRVTLSVPPSGSVRSFTGSILATKVTGKKYDVAVDDIPQTDSNNKLLLRGIVRNVHIKYIDFELEHTKLSAKWRPKKTLEMSEGKTNLDALETISRADFQQLVFAYGSNTDIRADGTEYDNVVVSKVGLDKYCKDLSKMLDKAWLLSLNLDGLEMSESFTDAVRGSISECGVEVGTTTVRALLCKARQQVENIFNQSDSAVDEMPQLRFTSSSVDTPQNELVRPEPSSLKEAQATQESTSGGKHMALKNAKADASQELLLTREKRDRTARLDSSPHVTQAGTNKNSPAKRVPTAPSSKGLVMLVMDDNDPVPSAVLSTSGPATKPLTPPRKLSKPSRSPARISIFDVLKDPAVRSEYRRREAECTGSGKTYLKLVTRQRRAEATGTSCANQKPTSFRGVVDCAVRKHKLTVRELLKDSWVREKYQACEAEKKGSGILLLRNLTPPGAVEDAKRKEQSGMTLSEPTETVVDGETKGKNRSDRGSTEANDNSAKPDSISASSKSHLLALVRKKRTRRRTSDQLTLT